MSGERTRSGSTLPTARTEDRYAQALADQYHARLQSLHAQIAAIRLEVTTDELLCTMRKDATSAQYSEVRAREITENTVIAEQEETIERLIEELAAARSERTQEFRGDEDVRLDVATKELVRARQGLQTELQNVSALHSENSLLQSKLEALELTLARSSEENEAISTELRSSLRENSELKLQVSTYERQVRDLEGKYLSYSGEFKEMLAESIGRQTQTYKEKSQQFKHKIVRQRDALKAQEDTISSLKKEIETLSATKSSLAEKTNALESALEAARKQTQDYDVKASELALTLQTTMDTRLSSVKAQYEDLLASARAKESHLMTALETKATDVQQNYMKVALHDEILERETSALRRKLIEERERTEKEIREEGSSRVSLLRSEFAEERKKLQTRIDDLEGDKVTLIAKRKEVEREREVAESRIRELNTRLAKSTVELDSLSDQCAKQALRLSETEIAVKRAKVLYEEEFAGRLKSEGERKKLAEEVAASYSEEIERALRDTKLGYDAQLRHLRTKVEELTEENGELLREVAKTQAENRLVQEERKEVLDRLKKTSQEQIEAMERQVEEERRMLVAESDAHNHTKSVLSSELEAQRRSASAQRQRDRALLTRVARDCRTQLRELKRGLARELSDFHRSLTHVVAETASEVDRHQLQTERRITDLLSSSKDLISCLHSEKSSLQDQSVNYEQRIRDLEALLVTIKAEAERKSQQLEGVLGRLEAVSSREQALGEEREAWRSRSFANEEQGAGLRDELRDLESVVESLRLRNEDNCRAFNQEILSLMESSRRAEEKRASDQAKSAETRFEATQKLAEDVKALKSSTVVALASLESDLTVLVHTIQSETSRLNSDIVRLKCEVAHCAETAERLKARAREESERAESQEKKKSALETELKLAKEELVRRELSQVRAEMQRTEAVMRGSKERY